MSRRRGGRGIARFFVIAILLIWAVPTLFTALGATIAAMVALPFLLVASIVAILAILVASSVAIAVAAGFVAVPAWLFWRASRNDRERRGRAARDDESCDDAEREASRLRRRYVAGQLTDDQYQDAMLAHLKARFASGSLDVSEYEAEVSRLFRAGVDSTPLRELRRSSRPSEKR
jgi:type VI protein secretion system component VasK